MPRAVSRYCAMRRVASLDDLRQRSAASTTPRAISSLSLFRATLRGRMAASSDPTLPPDARAVRMNAATALANSGVVSRRWYQRRAALLAPVAAALCIAAPVVFGLNRRQDAARCPQFQELTLFAMLFSARVLIVCLADVFMATCATDGPAEAQAPLVRLLLRIRGSWLPSWISLGIFLMGNIYVAQSAQACVETGTYKLALALLVLEYIQMLLPLLLMMLLLFAVCLCMPLLVRLLLASGAIPTSQQPATQDQIARLPRQRYEARTAQPGQDTCSICLEAYADGDDVRVLPCGSSHMFHVACVDNWLKINANCPVCRGQVLRNAGEPEPSNASAGSAATAAAANTSATAAAAAPVAAAPQLARAPVTSRGSGSIATPGVAASAVGAAAPRRSSDDTDETARTLLLHGGRDGAGSLSEP